MRSFASLVVMFATLLCARHARSQSTDARFDVGVPIPTDGLRPPSVPGRVAAGAFAIHGADGTPAEAFFAVRDQAIRDLAVLENELHFPEPLPDGSRGGDDATDVYLVPDGPSVEVHVDALAYGLGWDRASAFIEIRRDLRGDALARAVAEGVARASLLGIDVRAPRAWHIALATTLAQHLAALPPDVSTAMRFQSDPGAPIVRDRDDDAARGASMFTDFLAARYDSPDLALLRGLAWMAVGDTPASSPRLGNEPHVFGLLERLLRDEPDGLEGALAEFAIARALVASDGDAIDLAGGLRDPFLAPRWQRVVAYDQLPVWVTPAPLTDETGVAYVVVNAQDARGGRLSAWFHGVPWRRWRVDLVRLDDRFRVIARAPFAPVDHGEWSNVIESLDRVAVVLFVIEDLGNGNLDPTESSSRDGWFSLTLQR